MPNGKRRLEFRPELKPQYNPRNKVYSYTIEKTYAINENLNIDLLLRLGRQEFKIISIAFDYVIGVLNQFYQPKFDRNAFFVRLAIGRGLNDMPKISSQFIPTVSAGTIVGATIYDGSRFQMQYPGQLFFDAWYVNEQIELLYETGNNDPVNQCFCCASIMAEIQPLP